MRAFTPDMDALRAMRAASPALQEWWPDGESPRSWQGIEWSDDRRVLGLDLYGSKLEVLAPQIGQLQALTWLSLQGCPLKVLPPEIGKLQALTSLWLGGCPLVELPPEIGQLLALTWLHLQGSLLVKLPPEIDDPNLNLNYGPPPPKPSSPPPPPSPVVLKLTLSGSISDYSDSTSSLQQKIATAAGVDKSQVTISLAAGSVIMTATTAVLDPKSRSAVLTRLSFALGTETAASNTLGLPADSMESEPVIDGAGVLGEGGGPDDKGGGRGGEDGGRNDEGGG